MVTAVRPDQEVTVHTPRLAKARLAGSFTPVRHISKVDGSGMPSEVILDDAQESHSVFMSLPGEPDPFVSVC